MAKPIDFEHANMILKPAQGDEDHVSDLPVMRAATGDAVIYYSLWMLSKEELEEMQRTGCVWLGVLTSRHPPVKVSGTQPFTDVHMEDVKRAIGER